MVVLLLKLSSAQAETGPETRSELRGIWVTRWTYGSEQDVTRIIGEVADAGFNTVYFQVRGQHDAFYKSSIEPWAQELTGVLGQDPGWDPLAVAVAAARERGVKLHAYINAFTLWRGVKPPSSSLPSHAWDDHADWIVAREDGMPMELSEGYVYSSPGNPDARKRLADVARDIAKRYDVDGIHLDHIRYPDADYGYDMSSLAAWESAGRPDFDDWRRQQVTEAVKAVSGAVDVPVSAAVWGVYVNRWGWPGVSEGLHRYLQDAGAMTQQGSVDALIPMTYWRADPGNRLDFGLLVEEHLTRANGRHVYAGIRADPTWGAEAVVACVEAARKAGAHGVVVFEYSEGRAYFEALKATVFKEPAVPPAMDWR